MMHASGGKRHAASCGSRRQQAFGIGEGEENDFPVRPMNIFGVSSPGWNLEWQQGNGGYAAR